MISPRVALRAVQMRVGNLRRAVLAEVEDINRLIYHVLRAGVVLSVSLILFGFILEAFGAGGLPTQSIPPRRLLSELVRFTPAGYVNLGILVLIFTPMARVLLSLLSFLEERDRTFAAITLVVLVNLLTSFFFLA
ncbi:MAG TPA: DUF1634 domain-containing protein [Thermoplasmata archaeon]